jgi:uncharacterized protein (DUF849 family)
MTDMANVMERIANAEQFLPEICTLDAGTLNFGGWFNNHSKYSKRFKKSCKKN